ncbi:MAG: methionyl-tRNA formyltransferase [Clostridiales bacterium]|nr:methionyl-tRNA formyltransferase [Clostridiales bacterium]
MLKVLFLGTPDFAVLPLERLFEMRDKVEVLAVVTNPDRPFGRKQVLTACPVKKRALELGYKVLSYDKIRLEGVEDVKALNPDLMITCAFGQILSQELLDIPKHGVYNIHASLLPKYRGASPIHYAILNGETETGVTIMKTDIGIDTGDIILSKSLSIGKDETCGELFERLSRLGADCIELAINSLIDGSVTFTKQDETKATLTKMIKKEHAKIDWTKDANAVNNVIRAFNPSPVAYTVYNGEPLKIYQAELSDGCGMAGEIIESDTRLEVACGKGSLIIKKLQKSGGKPMDASDFLRGNKPTVGSVLG